MLFRRFDRTDATTKRYRETQLEFLDRSADLAVGAVRALLENAFDAYIESEKFEISQRLKSRRAHAFKSACFELLLYGMLVRQGYTLVAHPDPANGTDKRPDFLVTPPDGEPFFLEAIVVNEGRDIDGGAEAMKEDVLDALDRAPHPAFYLDIEQGGQPATQPSARALIRDVHAWINGLDAGAVVREIAIHGHGAYPRHAWHHQGWTLAFGAIPKNNNRGELDRLIGLLSIGGGAVDLKTPIREAIRNKGRRYGTLPHPLVVAISVTAFHLRDLDETDALFGSEGMAIDADRNARLVRAPDGAWHDGREPRSARVSAAWLFNDLDFYSLPVRRQTLYLNPWASAPLQNPPEWLPLVCVEEERFVRTEGMTPGQAFGLPGSINR
ncbi:hypothetical protein [Luteibacter sp. 9135]|uniref:hypothetical protein n=1 Tax=Luteibacter sp. 9135 TaxID=1500893 RepID=UPI00056BB852|nr:hypothetical protein [Luteibacter sp. 9135]